MLSILPRPRAIVTLATVVLAVGASVAVASAINRPEATSLSACVHAKGGGLYIARHCATRDRRVTWSVAGPQGARGAQGMTGLAGPEGASGAQGPQGTAGTTATTADNTSELGGLPAADYQRNVTGSCTGGSAVASIAADGSTSCDNTQFFAGQVTESDSSGVSDASLLTVPGIAQLNVLNCSSGGVNVQLTNDSSGAADLWSPSGGATDAVFDGVTSNWFSTSTAYSTTPSGTTWHLGVGSGSGAKVTTITESQALNNGTCEFQATAQVVTAG